MTRIGLISDTHGFLDDTVFEHFNNCDEIWHGGDFGEGVAEKLRHGQTGRQTMRPTKHKKMLRRRFFILVLFSAATAKNPNYTLWSSI